MRGTQRLPWYVNAVRNAVGRAGGASGGKGQRNGTVASATPRKRPEKDRGACRRGGERRRRVDSRPIRLLSRSGFGNHFTTGKDRGACILAGLLLQPGIRPLLGRPP